MTFESYRRKVDIPDLRGLAESGHLITQYELPGGFREFRVFKNADEFIKCLKDTEDINRCYHEVIMDGKPHKLWIDIDDVENFNEELSEEIGGFRKRAGDFFNINDGHEIEPNFHYKPCSDESCKCGSLNNTISSMISSRISIKNATHYGVFKDLIDERYGSNNVIIFPFESSGFLESKG